MKNPLRSGFFYGEKKGESARRWVVEVASRYVRLMAAYSMTEVEVKIEVKVAPRYAPALGGVYSVTGVKVELCEMSEAYFTGEVEPGFARQLTSLLASSLPYP
jgi:TRAP-type mannitol/chloroaromatic compound transport system substrate-binding protein